MFNGLIQNWKTSSAGIVLILTGLIHIGFSIAHGTISESDFTTTMVSIVTGAGLIVAGDASKSVASHEETKNMVADLQNQIAAVKHETATVAKPTGTP